MCSTSQRLTKLKKSFGYSRCSASLEIRTPSSVESSEWAFLCAANPGYFVSPIRFSSLAKWNSTNFLTSTMIEASIASDRFVLMATSSFLKSRINRRCSASTSGWPVSNTLSQWMYKEASLERWTSAADYEEPTKALLPVEAVALETCCLGSKA